MVAMAFDVFVFAVMVVFDVLVVADGGGGFCSCVGSV